MKIAYIGDIVYPYVTGGSTKRCWEISRRLVKRGHEVHWFGMKYWAGKDIIENEGIYYHGVCKPKGVYNKEGKRSIKKSIYFAVKIILPLLKTKFDAIDCQKYPCFPCFSAKFCSLVKREPLAIEWYETWGDYWYEYLGRKGIFGKIIEKMITRLPKRIIAISDRVKQDIVSLGVKKAKIVVVSNGVDFESIQNIKPASDELDVIFVGRLFQHKNVDSLIKAVDILRKDLPNIKCGIIGDGPEREKLVNLTVELNLEQNVRFFGFLPLDEDVISYMKSSKVFVLPSTREGFPNTILEANASSLPVIVVRSKNNAGVDVIEAGNNGFIVEPSPKAIAVKVKSVLDDKNQLQKLSRQAKAWAKEYDWEAIVSKLERVYGSL